MQLKLDIHQLRGCACCSAEILPRRRSSHFRDLCNPVQRLHSSRCLHKSVHEFMLEYAFQAPHHPQSQRHHILPKLTCGIDPVVLSIDPGGWLLFYQSSILSHWAPWLCVANAHTLFPARCHFSLLSGTYAKCYTWTLESDEMTGKVQQAASTASMWACNRR